jgi:hypothetical protein
MANKILIIRVSKVEDCALKPFGILPPIDNSEFFDQSCAVFENEIWMCGAYHDAS